MKFLLRAAIILLIALVCVLSVAYELSLPYAAFGGETFVDLPKGTGTVEIAARLTQAGVIAHWWEFLIIRALHPRRALKAGEYRFTQPATVVEVYDRIARGDLFYYVLTVREGENMFDIAAAAAKLKVFPAADFLAAARSPSLVRDLDPEAPALEGYLFPSTYHLDRRTTPEGLCQIMTGRFREVWKQLGGASNVHETVVLASLIEREAREPLERPLISSVFHNRLKMGMKLDCDPTTIYAALLEGRYLGTIHQSDLASENPYNTYRHAGLPPGPIANPGRDSLLAALHPAETDYLYFVLRPDGSGAHNFSKSITQHLARTAEFRRATQRQKIQENPPTRVSRPKKSRNPH